MGVSIFIRDGPNSHSQERGARTHRCNPKTPAGEDRPAAQSSITAFALGHGRRPWTLENSTTRQQGWCASISATTRHGRFDETQAFPRLIGSIRPRHTFKNCRIESLRWTCECKAPSVVALRLQHCSGVWRRCARKPEGSWFEPGLYQG